MEKKLTHIEDGRSKMVDVSSKELTERVAIARGRVRISSKTLKLIEEGNINKGNVYETARIAGIMGGKKTSLLIPMCHPIPIDQVDIIFWVENEKEEGLIYIEAMAKNLWKTGVEMEALIAVSIAALTIYDMVKSVERAAVIEEVKLIYKSGGKSGKIEIEEPVILNRGVWENLNIR